MEVGCKENTNSKTKTGQASQIHGPGWMDFLVEAALTTFTKSKVFESSSDDEK